MNSGKSKIWRERNRGETTFFVENTLSNIQHSGLSQKLAIQQACKQLDMPEMQLHISSYSVIQMPIF